MQFPLSIQAFGYPIQIHAVTEVLSMFIGFRVFLYLRKRSGDFLNDEHRIWVVIAAAFGALVGSRLIGGLENYTALKNADNILLHFYGNKTVAGGLAGGLLFVELAKFVLKIKSPTGDLYTFPFIVALVIGRIGCFTMGVYEETYGITSTLPWAIDLGDGVKRHPVTFYEIIFLVGLGTYIYWLSNRQQRAQGYSFRFFMVAYFVFRFLLDFIKPTYIWDIGLSTIQILSIMVLLWYSQFLKFPVPINKQKIKPL